ncbi:MAG: transposase [Planctomycetota bacterium]|jgi:transposase-like protein
MGEVRKKKRWSPEEIASVLKRVLLDRVEVSKVCEEAGCCPSQVYRWQKQLFDQSASVFERTNGRPDRKLRAADAKAAKLEAKLGRKAEVLSELMEERIRLRKSLGDL